MAKTKAASRPDLLVAAFEQISEAGLGRLVADRAGGVDRRSIWPRSTTRFRVPSALARRLGERLDRAMLAIPADELDGLSHRERLFELLMRRFDAMRPFKPGLGRLVREARGEPEIVLASLCNLDRMAGWLIEMAELPYSGIEARLARRALMLAYARLFRVWIDDDTPIWQRPWPSSTSAWTSWSGWPVSAIGCSPGFGGHLAPPDRSRPGSRRPADRGKRFFNLSPAKPCDAACVVACVGGAGWRSRGHPRRTLMRTSWRSRLWP